MTYGKKKLFRCNAEWVSQIKSMLMRTFWFVYFLKLYFSCNRRLRRENTFTTKLLFNLVNLERLWRNKILKHLVKPFLLTFIHYFLVKEYIKKHLNSTEAASWKLDEWFKITLCRNWWQLAFHCELIFKVK